MNGAANPDLGVTGPETGKLLLRGNMPDTVLETTGLTKDFGRRRAVDDLSLQVRAGDIYGFLGPNGAGKSTTIRMLVGLIRPTGGTARLFGTDVQAEHNRALGRIGALVESPAFYRYLSARDNLRILSRLSGGCSEARIDEVLDLVGLLDRARDKVKTYSHGMRQRLGIAQALLPDPELVILDEPTTGLDPEGMKDVRGLILRLANDLGKTVFLSSHLLHEVEQVCTRVGIVNRGRLVANGDVSLLLSRDLGLVEIRVGNGDRVVKVLDTVADVELVSRTGNVLSVRVSPDSMPALNRLIVESGIDLYTVSSKSASLEDLYLSLVQEGADAAQD